MHFKFLNVNEAFRSLVAAIEYPHETPARLPIRWVSSRVGPVKMVDEPVIITYERPWERVLFNRARDCNPFFHLFESLWMLAGRNDVAPLLKYNSKIGEIASDDGDTFNGAYGYRWRHAAPDSQETDQLSIIIDQLGRKPESRRVVLSMWNVEDDLLKIDTTKDVCCNTHAYFSLRNDPEGPFLDMTVCNRSNDMIWGMLGANVVHFSFLQEYLANGIGVKMGVYNQMTNNLHVYTERWTPTKWLEDRTEDHYKTIKEPFIPLVQDRITFDKEVRLFVHDYRRDWEEPFLNEVAKPMMEAFDHHRDRDYEEAFLYLNRVHADDWYIAGYNWIESRKKAWERKQDEASSAQ